MKWLMVLFVVVLSFSGCSFEENLNTQESSKDVTKKKLTIKEIDSLTASANISFTINNKPELPKK
jgi:hypothetical protein